jgi:hypothetical protein
VVSLAAAAVVENGLAAVGVPHGREPCGDFGDGGVPADLLEWAVCAAPERVEDALTSAVLIVIEPKRFLSRVSLRGWMGLVAPDLLEPAAVLAAEFHEDATVALAQDARWRFPLDTAFRHDPAVIGVSAANSIF